MWKIVAGILFILSFIFPILWIAFIGLMLYRFYSGKKGFQILTGLENIAKIAIENNNFSGSDSVHKVTYGTLDSLKRILKYESKLDYVFKDNTEVVAWILAYKGCDYHLGVASKIDNPTFETFMIKKIS